jgi:hypothetical protein
VAFAIREGEDDEPPHRQEHEQAERRSEQREDRAGRIDAAAAGGIPHTLK